MQKLLYKKPSEHEDALVTRNVLLTMTRTAIYFGRKGEQCEDDDCSSPILFRGLAVVDYDKQLLTIPVYTSEEEQVVSASMPLIEQTGRNYFRLDDLKVEVVVGYLKVQQHTLVFEKK